MDASALLTKQGWRGTGHGLGSTGHGIARPLLISNKQDALGVGKKKLQVADQWWMRAYDAGLKELGTGKQTALSSIKQNGMNRGGLYGFFVRGEGLAGTISDTSSSTSSPSDSSTPATTPEAESTPEPKKSEKKRKRAEGEEGKRKKRKEGSVTQSKEKSKKGRRSKQDSTDEAAPDAATEDPKLLRRAAKKALRQQRALEDAASNESKNEGSETPASETTKSSKGKEKRKREGKGTEREAKKVSEKKLKKYAAKAAEKGMTVEAYLAKKERKKEKAKK